MVREPSLPIYKNFKIMLMLGDNTENNNKVLAKFAGVCKNAIKMKFRVRCVLPKMQVHIPLPLKQIFIPYTKQFTHGKISVTQILQMQKFTVFLPTPRRWQNEKYLLSTLADGICVVLLSVCPILCYASAFSVKLESSVLIMAAVLFSIVFSLLSAFVKNNLKYALCMTVIAFVAFLVFVFANERILHRQTTQLTNCLNCIRFIFLFTATSNLQVI